MVLTAPKRVLCIMDISLTGRAGLSAVLPVLSSCGVQACALPCALLSTHTGGFGTPVHHDAADFCLQALAHFERENIQFDAIYTGYLCTPAQFAAAQQALNQYPHALHLADPAMADDGHLYSGLSAESVAAMQQLAATAGLITPNYTESALLCGEAPSLQPPTEAELQARLAALSQNGHSVVITSVPSANGGYETVGCSENATHPFHIQEQRVPAHYPGTGDAFAAAVCGLLLSGHSLQTAAQAASHFVQAAAQATYAAQGEKRHGLWLEPFLSLLHPQHLLK